MTGMKLRFKLRTLLIATAMLAFVAAFGLRPVHEISDVVHNGEPPREYDRRPELEDVASRLLLVAPAAVALFAALIIYTDR
jgi:hypothetical protein